MNQAYAKYENEMQQLNNELLEQRDAAFGAEFDDITQDVRYNSERVEARFDAFQEAFENDYPELAAGARELGDRLRRDISRKDSEIRRSIYEEY